MAKDVIKSLATASRHSFVDDIVENTLRVMWDICSIGLDAQAIALGRLHLPRALVVAMAIAQHIVDNNCHANEAKNRRSTMSRKQKDAKRGREEDRKVEDHSRRRRWGTRRTAIQEVKGKSAHLQMGEIVSKNARNKSWTKWAT